MSFISVKFILAFIAIFAVYWIIPKRFCCAKNVFLLIVSYLFYANYNPSFTLLLLGVTAVTYFSARCISGHSEGRHKKTIFVVSVILSLLPLTVFKYYDSFNNFVIGIFKSCGLNFALPGLNWAVPVGISFFTLQALGYLIDVYQEKFDCEKNFLNYALFVSFFPQISSGPISTAQELIPQIKREKDFSYSQFVSGMRFFLWGMFLKTVIADRAGLYVDLVFNSYGEYSGVSCLITSVLYSMQIYSDFAGYSCMAVGVGKILGFDLINNFERPYFSDSISGFWRRWHISLSRWLKKYIYFPLGGSKKGKIRMCFAIVITFLVSGIWHGAGLTFIVWGAIHGICVAIEKLTGWDKKSYTGIKKAGRIILTFLIVTFAWVFFRAPDMQVALGFIKRIITFNNGLKMNIESIDMLLYFLIGVIPLVIYDAIREFKPEKYDKMIKNKMFRFFIYLVLLAFILLTGVLDGNGFIYQIF